MSRLVLIPYVPRILLVKKLLGKEELAQKHVQAHRQVSSRPRTKLPVKDTLFG